MNCLDIDYLDIDQVDQDSIDYLDIGCFDIGYFVGNCFADQGIDQDSQVQNYQKDCCKEGNYYCYFSGKVDFYQQEERKEEWLKGFNEIVEAKRKIIGDNEEALMNYLVSVAYEYEAKAFWDKAEEIFLEIIERAKQL